MSYYYLWSKRATSSLKGISDGCSKLQPINSFGLLLILNPNIPHSSVKTLMTGEVFYGEGVHSLLMKPGTEGMPQNMGTLY